MLTANLVIKVRQDFANVPFPGAVHPGGWRAGVRAGRPHQLQALPRPRPGQSLRRGCCHLGK